MSYKKPLLLIIVLSVILCSVLSVLFMTDPIAAEGELEIVSEQTSKDESELISEELRGEVSLENESAEDISNDTVSFLGICGEKLTYEIKDSFLVIQGTGEMFDYNSYDAPWWNKDKIEHVTIKEGVTSIGEKAFLGMKIKSVSLPETLKTINSQAFQSCCLEEIIIPDSVDYVGGMVFEGCSSLESVSLGSSLKKTVGGTFRNCTSLKEVKLNNIEVISNEDFSGCTALEKIELEKVTTINNKAFLGCTSLLEINFSDSISYVGENVLNSTALYADSS
ncbi:MAG: leucine-rich repeat domain-containing protein, partial [Clostridia bacterium]|nr:leucine-rich repeat domain-containing protein [Clostridia bacterium]